MDRTMIDGMLNAFVSKDLEKVLSFFAEDALVYDPHYPVPEMRGKAAIRQGFVWGLDSLKQPGFQIRNCWIDGNKAVVEVDTHHVIRGGMETKFPQVFVFESRDGLITRLQSYVPYPPSGIPRLLASVTRFQWKLQGKVK